jgi:hypothetical protein
VEQRVWFCFRGKRVRHLTLFSGFSKTVDIFNGFTRAWSTAELSVARSDLAATSLPAHALAFFAGGECDTGCFFRRMLMGPIVSCVLFLWFFKHRVFE